MSKNNSDTVRVGKDFNKEIEDVKKERVDRGIDKIKKSTRRLTNLLVRHKLWPKIKKEMMEVNLDREIKNEE